MAGDVVRDAAHRQEAQHVAFGGLLRQFRLQAGLTQEALAERAGLSVRGIADLERGARRFPYTDTVERLAAALGLTAAERAELAAAGRRSDGRRGTTVAAGERSHPAGLLPVPPTRLIGRERELEDLCHRVLDPDVRLLTLTGPGGTGKTRLALAVVERLRQAFEHGTFFVDLAPLADPALVVPSVARMLGLTEVAGQSPLEHLAEALANRHCLLVLDNCEHVVGAGFEVAHLLAACPRVCVLTTSREPLHLEWEHRFPVSPLALPDADARSSPAALTSVPSVALFVERAQAIDPSFAVVANNCAAVADVCARLDGLPLALELAAARVSVLSVAEIRVHLGRRLDVLHGPRADRVARHRSLRATLDWSYELLASAEQCLLRRLAVFAGGWTLEAAEAVCAGDALAAEDVLDLLSTLVERSLVVAEHHGDHTWYRLLETVHVYARERLEQSGEELRVWRRHRDYYLALAESTPPELFEPEPVEREVHNVRAALAWSIQTGDAEQAARLCEGMWSFWTTRRHTGEGCARIREVLALSALQDGDRARARLLTWLSHLTYARGDLTEAASLAWQGLTLARTLGDVRAEMLAHGFIGHVARHRGDLTAARSHYETMLVMSRQSGNWMVETHGLHFLALVLREQGDHEQAQALSRQALVVGREQGNRYFMARALTNLGEMALAVGDRAVACSYLAEAVALNRALGDKQGLSWAVLALGLAEMDVERARLHCLESLELAHASGDPIAVARGLDGLASLTVSNAPEQTTRLLAAAEALRARVGAAYAPQDRARVERLVGTTRRRLGERCFVQLWDQGRYLSTDDAIALANQLTVTPQVLGAQPASTTPSWPLSAREREVARLVAQGLTNRQIAASLVIAERTAEHHVENIMAKLGVNSRTQVGVWAAEHGLDAHLRHQHVSH